jgi:(S)-2-hydroxyglutarate dehydrogenase
LSAAGTDVVVVGCGIVGLATALQLLERRPDLRITLVDKENGLARHQTGHNSGVLHAGLYYAPGSFKARLCRAGKTAMEAYAERRDVPIDHVGKLVVALHEDELPRMATLLERGRANGVEGLEEVGPERLREIEPHAAGVRALWSPRTAIIDFVQASERMADDIRAKGAEIRLGVEVTAVRDTGRERVVATAAGDIVARNVIVCAGLQSDRLRTTAVPADVRIIPFRGDYYSLRGAARDLVRGLIYPVPDPRFPFLGVHLTRRIDGEVWAGPNAVLAFAREGYRRRDVNLRDLADVVRYRGFWNLARRHWRTGVSEFWRDYRKSAFLAEIQRYVPAVTADDIVFGPSGIRGQALSPAGDLVDDFVFDSSPSVIHVRNAPSPAATASLAIGDHIASMAVDQFGLA